MATNNTGGGIDTFTDDGNGDGEQKTEEWTLPTDGGSAYVEGVLAGDVTGKTQLCVYNWDGDLGIAIDNHDDALVVGSSAELSVDDARVLRDVLDEAIEEANQ